jgi:hypothetical protein
MVSSQLSMKQKMKEQMDDFLSRLWKVKTSTPPPQPMPVESMASNIAHADQTPPLGDNSLSMPMFKLSISPASHYAQPKTTASTSFRPNTPQKPSFLAQTPSAQPPNRTFPQATTIHTSENPQFGLPVSLWPPNSSPRNTLQPQFPHHINTTLPTHPTIPAGNTYTQHNRPQYPNPQISYQQPNY